MQQLNEENEYVRDFCISILEELLTNFKEYKIPYLELGIITKALDVLNKYPMKTIHGYIEISASTRYENGMGYANMVIAADYFELNTGGSEYTEGIGSDSFSKTIYNSESGFEGDMYSELNYWKEAFDSHKYNLRITDESSIITDKTEAIIDKSVGDQYSPLSDPI